MRADATRKEQRIAQGSTRREHARRQCVTKRCKVHEGRPCLDWGLSRSVTECLPPGTSFTRAGSRHAGNRQPRALHPLRGRAESRAPARSAGSPCRHGPVIIKRCPNISTGTTGQLMRSRFPDPDGLKLDSASPLTASTFAAETTAGDYQRYTSLDTGRVWSSMVSIRIGFLVNREECIANHGGARTGWHAPFPRSTEKYGRRHAAGSCPGPPACTV
jgi:hypothetical protein